MERRTGQVSTLGLLARPPRLRGTNPDCLRTTSKSPSKMFGMKERQSSSILLRALLLTTTTSNKGTPRKIMLAFWHC